MVDSSAGIIERGLSTSRARVRMPGTCGELVQGRIDGVAFHVSCPINLYSEVEVELTASSDLWVVPGDAPKAARAMQAALSHLGLEGLGGKLSIRSSLPRGKGMASSTADVAGTIFALFAAAGRPASPDLVADIALSVEPTDGSMFPGIALFDHRTGLLRRNLGRPPRIDMVVLDFGGEIDTLEFNRRDHEDQLKRLQPKLEEALQLVTEGMATGNPGLIGRGATMSALANQTILPKPELPRVLALAEEIGALGVNVGHSGTVIGVLLDPAKCDSAAVYTKLHREFSGLQWSLRCRLIGGGFHSRGADGSPDAERNRDL